MQTILFYFLRHFPIAACKLYYIFGQSSVGEIKTQDTQQRVPEIENSLNKSFSRFHEQTFKITPSKSLFNSSIIFPRQSFNMSGSSIGLPRGSLEHLGSRLANNMYYLNFVLNFFLYTLNIPKFRNIILKNNKDKKCQRNNQILTSLRSRKSKSQLFN